MDVKYFASQAEFRDWLEENHATQTEIWVGFYNKKSGQTGIAYPQAVDEALCFGWIDGIRKKVDEMRYTNRFTPRKARSHWSTVNLKRYDELMQMGMVRPAGQATYEARKVDLTRQYSFEQDAVNLSDEEATLFRANAPAWAFFQMQPASYRKTATWWVMSAKKEETRRKRLNTLISDSEKGFKIASLRRATDRQPDES